MNDNKITGENLRGLIGIITGEDNDFVRDCIKFAEKYGYLTQKQSDALWEVMKKSKRYVHVDIDSPFDLLELTDMESVDKFLQKRKNKHIDSIEEFLKEYENNNTITNYNTNKNFH